MTSCAFAWVLLVALQSAPAPAAPASLRDLAAESEWIAWVRVDEVRRFDLGDSALLRYLWPHGDVPYASVTVESVVHGDGHPSSLLVCVGDVESGAIALGAGERALVFLEADNSLGWRLRDCPTPGAEAFVAGRRPRKLRPGGLWRITHDERSLVVPRESSALALGSRPEISRAMLEQQLDLALDLELPRFEIQLISTGANPFRVRIAADGRMTGVREGQVSPEDLRVLWETVERERFHELPELVGATGGPCLTAMDVCVVTRNARRCVGIVLGAIDEMPDGELRDATQRALRIWDALPIPERPVLR